MTATRQIPSGDPRAGGPDGVRARAGPLVAVGNDQLDRLEVRDDVRRRYGSGCDGLRSTAAHGRGSDDGGADAADGSSEREEP